MDNEVRLQHDTRRFIVPGIPQGKGRPRASRMAGSNRVRMYTPAKTTAYEAQVRGCYLTEHGCKKPMSGAIKATIVARFPVPKRASKRMRAKMLTMYYTKKVDCDNAAKIVLDALNRVAYADDKQIAVLEVLKVYGETPCVEVVLDALSD